MTMQQIENTSTAPATPHAQTLASASPAVPALATDAEKHIEWCLLSHTNIGKTTLTRTLTGGDVGEVADGAHVTEESQRYLLQSTPQGDQLWLWDTPGFGDSLRLYQRLRQQGNPLGWFLSHVWDRWRDKPFYLSQRALQAAREHGDVVLYLVNASEDPADAGYWNSEMGILQWLGKPVIVLLNQVGSHTSTEQTLADMARWRAAIAPWKEMVREVLVLDAFTRSWWHERKMLLSIAALLPAAKLPAYARLLAQREAREKLRQAAGLQTMAEQLLQSATACETPQAADEDSGKLLGRVWKKISQSVGQKWAGTVSGTAPEPPAAVQAAMQRLLAQVQQADARATGALLQTFELNGEAASQIQQQLQSQLQISTPINAQSAGLWGALATGAATGLGADLLTGGMTLGAGAVIGALVGAVGFAGAALGVNKMFDQEQQRVELSPAYLTELVAQVLLKYLVISHFGRGRGRYTATSAPAQWSRTVQAVVHTQLAQWLAIWQQLRAVRHVETSEAAAKEELPASAALQDQIEGLLQQALAQVMQQLYPEL